MKSFTRVVFYHCIATPKNVNRSSIVDTPQTEKKIRGSGYFRQHNPSTTREDAFVSTLLEVAINSSSCKS